MDDLPDYLKSLETFSRPLPEDAILSALDNKDVCLPIFREAMLSAVGRYWSFEIDVDYMLLTYAIHILAQWGENSAYPVIVELAKQPIANDLLGDSITDEFPKIFAAVWDGDHQPLFDLISDAKVDEFARSAAILALGILYGSARINRTEFQSALAHIHEHCLPSQPNETWNAWVMVVSDFGYIEFKEHIHKAFKQGFTDHFYQSEENALSALEAWQSGTPNFLGNYRPYTTVIEELSAWHRFSEEDDDFEDKLDDVPNTYTDPLSYSEPYKRSEPKIGRNDPCPCGSGRKYKRCCLTQG